MKKLFIFCSFLFLIVFAYAKTPKIVKGSFDVLKNEKYIGTTIDFSKASFDCRSLDEYLYAMNLDNDEWKEREEILCVAMNRMYAYETCKGITLGLKEVKKTKYYLKIYPLKIDINDGECDVEVHLFESESDNVIAVATGHADPIDHEEFFRIAVAVLSNTTYVPHAEKNSANWEENIAHAFVSIGKNVLYDLLKF